MAFKTNSDGYSFKKIVKSFWALPTLCTVLAVSILCALLVFDRQGASVAIAAWGWPFDISGETARETAATLTGVIVALMALFFSITLIVMTMASSALGVRLIDRWIGNRVIRITLSILLSLLAVSIILLVTVDPNGPADRIPRLSLICFVLALVSTIPWLAYAYHHLSRRIHVDTSIVDLGKDLKAALETRNKYDPVQHETSGANCKVLKTSVSGYIEAINISALLKECEHAALEISLQCEIGQFVLSDDVLANVWCGKDISDERLNAVQSSIKIGGFRTDGQGARFQSMLLAEIAARALSPAVNDLYTATACIDHLFAAFAPALTTAKPDGWIADETGRPAVQRQGRHIILLLNNPLRVIRHAAAPYPTVSIHLAEMVSRLREIAKQPCDKDYLTSQQSQIVRAGLEHASLDEDYERLDAFRPDGSASS